VGSHLGANTVTTWVVVPFSDDRFADTVRDNFERQSCACELVVVENNGAKYPHAAGATLESGPGKHRAIAEAMAFIGRRPVDSVVLFDQDDWYGQSSVGAKVTELESVDIVASQRRWVQTEDGEIVQVDCDEHDQGADPWRVWGGSVAWRASAYRDDFGPHHAGASHIGDTQNWVGRRVESGCSFRLSKFPDCYIRHGGRTVSRITSDFAIASAGGALKRLGRVPLGVVEDEWHRLYRSDGTNAKARSFASGG
jgi:hypothetical protein